MTQSDLQEARTPSTPETDRRRGRNRYLGAAVALVLLAVAGGVTAYQVLGDDDPSSSSDKPEQVPDPDANFLSGRAPNGALVQGIWRVDNDHRVLAFHADGTFAYTEQGNVFTAPSSTGTWALAGDEITITTTSTTKAGCIGDFFTVRASLPATGSMHFVHSAASPGDCSPMVPRQWVLEQLLPSEFFKDFVVSTERGWDPLTATPRDLQGFWLAEAGAGFAIELGPKGEYVVAGGGGEPVDHGEWSFGDQELVLTSGSNSPTCDQGDRMAITGMETVNPGTPAIRGTVSQNTCQAPWTSAAWFLIPDIDG
jgi:hypothetical protein